MPGVIVDGNDVLAVYEATQVAAAARARGGGPTLIEAKTYRQRGHYEGDPMVYRTQGGDGGVEGAAIPSSPSAPVCWPKPACPKHEIAGIERPCRPCWTKPWPSPPPPQAAPETALAGVYGDTHGGLVF